MVAENYFIVEARLPIHISEAASVEEAARIAARRIEREYGIDVANWFLRVFEYDGQTNGPVAEHFSSPGGKFRKIDRNVLLHEEMGKDGNGVSED